MLEQALELIRQRTALAPRAGVVLGSGLGGLSARLAESVEIPYREIPGWPVPSVEGHAGKLVLGELAGVPVAVMEGRVHLYEGWPAGLTVFGVRVMAALGARTLVVTCAAGGIDPSLRPGGLAAIRDHINLQGATPLEGARFVDMSDAYSSRLRAQAKAAADEAGIPLGEGVYAALRGPNFETPAEVRYLRAIGADMVGMSVVQETIAARAEGMAVLGIACITNVAAGLAEGEITHQEVIDTGRDAGRMLARVIEAVLPLV